MPEKTILEQFYVESGGIDSCEIQMPVDPDPSISRPEVRNMASIIGNTTSQLKNLREMRRTYSTVKVVILTVTFFLYLFLGAILFSFLENEQQTQSFKFVVDHLGSFYQRNKECVDPDELSKLVFVVVDACEHGFHHLERNVEDILVDNITGKWNLANSFFFSATVVTTIGYGSITPQTREGRGVCIIYALIGIPLTALLLTEVGHLLKYNAKCAVMKVSNLFVKISRNETFIKIATWFLAIFVLYGVLICLPSIILSHLEGWAYHDAHYYCFITLTTIGFGDMVAGSSPNGIDYKNGWTRWLFNLTTTIYFLCGLSVVAAVFSTVSHGGAKKMSELRDNKILYHMNRRLSNIFHLSGEEETRVEAVDERFPSGTRYTQKKSRSSHNGKLLTRNAEVDVESTRDNEIPWKETACR